MNILLSAFVCEPGLGSEEGVGWGTAWTLAQRHRVHVLTRPDHRTAIERFLAAHPTPSLSFSYYDISPGLRRGVVTSTLWQIYYHAWQARIARWAEPVCDAFAPDVVHHITYGRYWTPCSLYQLGRPFVWGPLGGGDACPPAFLAGLNWRERAGDFFRRAAQRLAGLDPQLRATARHADVVLASTPATANRLAALGSERTVCLLQMALDESLARRPYLLDRTGCEFCAIGRLLGWKGQWLAIRAFAEAAIPHSRLTILGEGPALPGLRRLAERLGVATSVEFRGGVPRAEALAQLERSIALIHPSLHDQAPTVVFEAMALGTPTIALRLAGPSLQITAATGFLVEADCPHRAIPGLAGAMRALALDPLLRRQLGAAGRERVLQEFTWEKQAERFEELYKVAIHRRQSGRTAGSTAAPPPARSLAPELLGTTATR